MLMIDSALLFHTNICKLNPYTWNSAISFTLNYTKEVGQDFLEVQTQMYKTTG